MSQRRCTNCAAEDVEIYGVQRICAGCKTIADDVSLDMAAALHQWLSYSALAEDAPETLVAKTKKILEGIPK